MSSSATASGESASRASSISRARCATSAPWLSVPGQGVVPGRRDERVRLAVDPGLRGAEDEEQHARRDDRGGEREDDDVAPEVVEPGEQRIGVAPQPATRTVRSLLPEGQVLADQGGRAGRPRPRPRPAPASTTATVGEPGSAARKSGDRLRDAPCWRGVARRDDAAVRRAELRVGDAAFREQRPERRAHAVRGRRAGRSGVEAVELALDERRAGCPRRRRPSTRCADVDA